MATKTLTPDPLQYNVAIVNPGGFPTPQFIQQWEKARKAADNAPAVAFDAFTESDAVFWGGGVTIASSSDVFQTANHPTDVAGYGITDVYTKTASDARFAAIVHFHAASDVTSGTFADARISLSSVAQWQGSLAIGYTQLTGLPTTLAGYGITDAYTKVASDARFAALVHTHAAADIVSGTFADARIAQSNVTQHQAALSIAYAQLTGVPTTLGGFGITDAYTKTASDARFAAIAHTHDAADIVSGTLALARISGLTDTQVAAGAAIGWSKISKTGSALGDLATRSVADLQAGVFASGVYNFPGNLAVNKATVPGTTFDVSGSGLFSSNVSLGGTLFLAGFNTAPSITHSASGFDFRTHATTGTDYRFLGTGGGELFRFTAAGAVLNGTITTTSVSAGDYVSPNNRGLRAVKNAGGDTYPLISLNASDQVSIDAGAHGVIFGASIATTYTDAKLKTLTGTSARITVGGTSTDPTVDISASYVGQATITTLGTITGGTWQGTSISTTYTDAKLKTLTGTTSRVTIGGTSTDPTVDISASYVGQSSITTLGTIGTGTWQGTAVADTYLAALSVSKLTGTTLPASVVSSSLTSLGTITALRATKESIGDTAASTAQLSLIKQNQSVTTGTTQGGIDVDSVASSAATTLAYGVRSKASVDGAAFTAMANFYSAAGALVSGSGFGNSLADYYGLYMEDLGFSGAAQNWNIRARGNHPSALAGSLSVGSATPVSASPLDVTGNGTFSGSVAIGTTGSPTVALDVTGKTRQTDTGSLADGKGVFFGGNDVQPSIVHSATGFDFRMHATTGTPIRFLGTGGSEVARITSTPVFALNTTNVTNAAAGEFVVPNAKAYRASNAAASDTLRLIEANSSNRVLVDGAGVGLQYGLALITLGTTTLITLGKTGGSGPATAAQNSWMKLWDASGVAFFVPVWK